MDFENMQGTLSEMAANFEFLPFLKLMLIVSAAYFLVGLVFRLLLGKRSSLNKSVQATMGILMLYVLTIALIVTNSKYQIFTAPLPFITVEGEYLTIFTLKGADTAAICTQLVNAMVLAFLIGLIDDLIPEGKNFFTWLLLRCISVVLGLAGHWATNWLFSTYLPGFIVAYAPIVLIVVLVVLLAVTIFKLLIGTVLGLTVSPIIGAIYTFFISNLIGKQIVRAVMTTLLLTLMVAVLNHLGVSAIYLGTAVISAFLPALALVILVWYLLFRFL